MQPSSIAKCYIYNYKIICMQPAIWKRKSTEHAKYAYKAGMITGKSHIQTERL